MRHTISSSAFVSSATCTWTLHWYIYIWDTQLSKNIKIKIKPKNQFKKTQNKRENFVRKQFFSFRKRKPFHKTYLSPFIVRPFSRTACAHTFFWQNRFARIRTVCRIDSIRNVAGKNSLNTSIGYRSDALATLVWTFGTARLPSESKAVSFFSSIPRVGYTYDISQSVLHTSYSSNGFVCWQYANDTLLPLVTWTQAAVRNLEKKMFLLLFKW